MELVYDFFEDSAEAVAAVRSRRPLGLGVLGWLLGALSFFAVMAVSGRVSPLPWGGLELAFCLLWELATGCALVAFVHLIADFQGRRGSASELFVLFGLADLAWALVVPAVFILTAVCPRAHWLLAASFLIVGYYNLSLKARCLRDAYQMSLGRAWVTLALPYLAAFLAGALVFSLAIASLLLQILKGLG